MNVLYLYNSTQTFTNTVFEHIDGFRKYSCHRSFFAHQDPVIGVDIDLELFDAVGFHYTNRLPFDQVAEATARRLEVYGGVKFLFIQDEYDFTHRAWYWIKRLGINLVFTVVPEAHIPRVYPPDQFPGVRFVSNLTGYVPENIPIVSNLVSPSQRSLLIGYRGRSLPVRYGALGFEKIAIGKLTKDYCEARGLRSDIAWQEEARIYGPRWYEFMASCRAMLGSESGSNVFDWDGRLEAQLKYYEGSNPGSSNQTIYQKIVAPLELPGLMNQVSPRVFEAIALRTVLVLFEGSYSGAVTPGVHYIPLKKDGSNLEEVFLLLNNAEYVDAMADRAYRDVIASGNYSYKEFVRFVDGEIESLSNQLSRTRQARCVDGAAKIRLPELSSITTMPIQALPPTPAQLRSLLRRVAIFTWGKVPEGLRGRVRPHLKRVLRRG